MHMARRVTPSGRHGSSGKGSSGQMPANTDRLVPRAPPLAGPGQSPGLAFLPGLTGPETDMRSSPPARDRRDQAGGRNLPLLPHPNRTKCHSSAVPPDPERSHSGSDLMGFFDAQSVTSWLIRDYAFPQTWLGKSGPRGAVPPRHQHSAADNTGAYGGRFVHVV
jgi:hypothetical protein